MKHNAILHNIPFNTTPSLVMHIDLNSCFATIEQQANHFLRNKAIAVAAYNSPNGCILAPSVDAKKYGIKTGMRVKDARLLYHDLIVLEPDPSKYRYIHRQLKDLLSDYTEYLEPKSIDEFVLDFRGHVRFNNTPLLDVGREIKERIKSEIGDCLTVSIGISTNRFLAKTASNLHKPDGLDEINHTNYLEIYKNLGLRDLCGIDKANSHRLNSVGVYNVLDLYNAHYKNLCQAFESKVGYYWYLRLRGFEIDDNLWSTKTIGHSYSLPKPFKTIEELAPIIQKLVEKVARRLRKQGFLAKGVHLGVYYRNGSFWHKGKSCKESLFESTDVFKKVIYLLRQSPTYSNPTPIRNIYITSFNLQPKNNIQLELFNDLQTKVKLTAAFDKIAEKYGEFSVVPANMLPAKDYVPDRIAFGKVKEIF